MDTGVIWLKMLKFKTAGSAYWHYRLKQRTALVHVEAPEQKIIRKIIITYRDIMFNKTDLTEDDFVVGVFC